MKGDGPQNPVEVQDEDLFLHVGFPAIKLDPSGPSCGNYSFRQFVIFYVELSRPFLEAWGFRLFRIWFCDEIVLDLVRPCFCWDRFARHFFFWEADLFGERPDEGLRGFLTCC